MFSDEPPPAGENDDSVVLFSAPGEGREAVEIARRLLQEAERGVPFDQMAVLLRAPQTYLSVLEHALDRAGIPAWFNRGTRRPDPAGRALLALLACADEELSARRFAEYVSLGQVPLNEAGNADQWSPPADDIVEAVLPPDERAEDAQPEEEAEAQIARGESDRDLAGTLRAPWRWEDLIVEAAVIGRLDRWQRRLKGLEHEYDRRVREASSEDPEASRVRALVRDREQLRALRAFAEPILAEMAEWPAAQSWGDWLSALERLAPRVIAETGTRAPHVARACAAVGDRAGDLARSAGCVDAAALDADPRAAATQARPRVRRHAWRPPAADRSASCSCPVLPSECSRSASVKMRCCQTPGARPPTARLRPSREEPPTNDCS